MNETMNNTALQKSELPYLTLKVNEQFYCLNVRHVADIVPCPEEVTGLPDAPHFIRGVINLRGQIIPLAPLRTLLSMQTLEEEEQTLAQMLEQRKADHLNWVQELERCAECGEPFTLATDPHKCAFGKWYYSYKPKSLVLQHHMQKLEEPHTRLHHAALEFASFPHDCENCTREECLRERMGHIKEEIVPLLLALLDETIAVHRDSLREMVVVLQDEHGRAIGVTADEVLSVGEITAADAETAMQSFSQSPFIIGVANAQGLEGTVLRLDEDKLLDLLGT